MFTVGICSSDRREYLAQALESVLVQSYTGPIEIVVSDDSSTTFDPKEVLRAFAKHFASRNTRLRLVVPKNESASEAEPAPIGKQGEAAMRNQIIINSTMPYIVWLDDDDRLLDETLAIYAKGIEEVENCEVLYGNLIRTDLNFKPTAKYKYRDVPKVLLPSSLLLGSIIPNGGTCIKRTVFEKIGLYDTSFSTATDYQFWARAALSKINFKYLDSDIYLYRSHENNAALDKEDDNFFDTNGRVCELILRNLPPHHLFPFFEWKNDKLLADFQVTLSVLALAKRNRREVLVTNCLRELNQNETFAKFLEEDDLQAIFANLKENLTLTFEQTSKCLANIVEAGQKKLKPKKE